MRLSMLIKKNLNIIQVKISQELAWNSSKGSFNYLGKFRFIRIL
jgi:hypothetical protein